MRDAEESLIDNSVVYQHVEKIMASPMFADAERLRRFLAYIVEHSLAGIAGRLKGYAIGVEVFDRSDNFDPNVDSIVRVEAGRLRTKLNEYYAGPGREDVIVLSIPKGGYAIQIGTSDVQPRATIDADISQPLANSVAVLPIVSLSSDLEQGYFADGMTDAIINRLGRNGALRVTSFTSVMNFKEQRLPLTEIARALNVKYVVEGSCLPSGDRARVTAQLIDAATDTHVWADSYDLKLSDVLVTQDEVATQISTAMGLALRHQIIGKTAPRVNPDAFEANLQGRRYRMQLTEEGLSKAITCFEQAIAIDPSYSEPYAGIAGCYCSFGTFGLEARAPHEVIPEGMKVAAHAIELDESLVEGRVYLGIMKLKYAWDWPGAKVEFERALSINPSDGKVLSQYALYFETIGKFDQAVEYAQRAYAIDPFNKGIQLNLAWQLHQLGESTMALEVASQLATVEPELWLAHWVRGHVLRAIDRLDEARAAFATAHELPGGNTLPLEGFGHCCAVMGDEVAARDAIAVLDQMAQSKYVPPYRSATILAGLGERDQMYTALDNAFDVRARSMAWLGVAQEYRAYGQEARFRDLVERIGIPIELIDQ